METATKSHSRSVRAKEFFDKHGPALTFAGALIVFLTFVAKEGIAEYWKETVAAVGQAESSFRSTGLSIELLRRVNVIENSVERLEVATHGLNPDIRIDEERINAVANEQNLAIVEELLMKLHLSDSEVAANLKAAQAQSIQHSEAIRLAAERLANTSDPVALASEMMPLTMAGMVFEHRVNEVVRSVRRIAVEQRERCEHNLSIARWVSYFLYVVGWALSLAGKFFGSVNDEASE